MIKCIIIEVVLQMFLHILQFIKVLFFGLEEPFH